MRAAKPLSCPRHTHVLAFPPRNHQPLTRLSRPYLEQVLTHDLVHILWKLKNMLPCPLRNLLWKALMQLS